MNVRFGSGGITLITRVFNSSLKKQFVPCLRKLANITPIPKETPFETYNQLKPISLTNVTMGLLERLLVKQKLSPALRSAIGPDQFAYKEGCNTTLVLVTRHHHWLKRLNGAIDLLRVFSFDFSRAFGSVSHAIFCNNLMSLNINLYVINRIVSFLSKMKQRVVVLAKQRGTVRYCPRAYIVLYYGKRWKKTRLPGAQFIAQIC